MRDAGISNHYYVTLCVVVVVREDPFRYVLAGEQTPAQCSPSFRHFFLRTSTYSP